MTTPHPLAEFIIAFAQGKKVTTYWGYKTPRRQVTNLEDFDAPTAGNFRIEPDTLTVNGVECVAPVMDKQGCVLNLSYGTRLSLSSLHFNTESDRDAFREALIKPFKEYLK